MIRKVMIMQKKTVLNPENTLVQQCYNEIKNDIIEGVLKPGQKLKVEMFKQRFSVGQSPIREALSQLLMTGLVTTEENKGFRVAKISEADVRDIYATFTIIETNALKLAIKHGDENWEATIVAEFHKLSLIENNPKEVPYELWADQNYKFHRALIAGCNSPALLEIQNILYLQFDRYCRMAYHMNPQHTSTNHDQEKKDDHKKIVDAVLKRDTKTAVDLMTYHINEPLKDVIHVLKTQKMI